VIDEPYEELDISRFVGLQRCDVCHGARLCPEALAVTIGNHSISSLGEMPLPQLRDFLATPSEWGGFGSAASHSVAAPLITAILARIGFLLDVGLGYLSLNRGSPTLSSGEGQRIRLATQIGAGLMGVLYVLDEPSVGLHARDHARLLAAQVRLRELGNSVLVVEHDRDAILAADYVVDMGPGAGSEGGSVVASGTPAQLMQNPNSQTGPWLAGTTDFAWPAVRVKSDRGSIVVRGARLHNLKNLTVEIPIGLLTVFTGVSGSGKSSLVVDTLLPAARGFHYQARAEAGLCDAVTGLDQIDKVISVDQAPIGRTPRSSPATYTGIFSLLRELFAGLPEARARGYKPGRFSFNVKGGRCEACTGDGTTRVQMHFLPDIFVVCEACQGARYNRETLEIRYRGYSIAEILALPVSRASELFGNIPRLHEKFDALQRLGLGYLSLGQPATTLSGGEAQRIKLAGELSRRATGKTLYVLDEPTTGLHFSDIAQLLEALTELRDQGNTVVLIEHNIDVIAFADWVIDMGPEAGQGGGQLVVAGTPETVAACPASHTGKYLLAVLARMKKAPA
jgi:excinuclease ABC subunit A